MHRADKDRQHPKIGGTRKQADQFCRPWQDHQQDKLRRLCRNHQELQPTRQHQCLRKGAVAAKPTTDAVRCQHESGHHRALDNGRLDWAAHDMDKEIWRLNRVNRKHQMRQQRRTDGGQCKGGPAGCRGQAKRHDPLRTGARVEQRLARQRRQIGKRKVHGALPASASASIMPQRYRNPPNTSTPAKAIAGPFPANATIRP